jgi:prophage regulatory protein
MWMFRVHEAQRNAMQQLLNFETLVALGYVNNRVTLTRRIKRGEFPAPIRISSRNVAWLQSEIEAWEAARVATRDQCARNASVPA